MKTRNRIETPRAGKRESNRGSQLAEPLSPNGYFEERVQIGTCQAFIVIPQNDDDGDGLGYFTLENTRGGKFFRPYDLFDLPLLASDISDVFHCHMDGNGWPRLMELLTDFRNGMLFGPGAPMRRLIYSPPWEQEGKKDNRREQTVKRNPKGRQSPKERGR